MDMAEETQFIQFKLRIPAELHGRLEQAATAAGRSITAEMVTRLDRSLNSIEDMIIEHRLAEMRVNGYVVVEMERKLAMAQAELDLCRGPGQMDRRRELLAVVNQLKGEISTHLKFQRLLDDQIEAVRNGDLPQAQDV